MNDPKKYIFHASGMHCNACVLMIESELRGLPHITHAKADLKRHSVEVSGDFAEKSQEAVAAELSRPLARHGYGLSVEKRAKEKKWADFKIAIPIALGFGALFIALQKVGLVNLVSGGNVSYGTAFAIGVIASLSTCMAVVGGLLLSMSATSAKHGGTVRPQLLFHSGRIVAFFVLGGVIGKIGSAFQLNAAGTFMLGLAIGIVMLILGVNLLDVFPWAKRMQLPMPRFLSKHAMGASKLNHALAPLLFGIATFFLPCGFTQSMQLYALTTGTFFKGGLTMLSFALGTLPVLALISFSSFSVRNGSKSGIFFKAAGLVVIMFAVFNLINSLVVVGAVPPIFDF